MAEIIPAPLPTSYEDLQEKINRVAPYVKTIQVDVTDGVFAGVKSWPYADPDHSHLQELREEKEGLPHWEELNFEVDLMVSRPEVEFERYVTAGVMRLIFHYESTTDFKKLVEMVEQKYGNSSDNMLSPEIGIALSNDTPLEEVFPFLPLVRVVQCMGIAKIGYQGLPFDERVLRRIETLRARDPELVISVDGGVDRETAPRLVATGVNRLVIGHAIFESDNVAETIKWFQSL